MEWSRFSPNFTRDRNGYKSFLKKEIFSIGIKLKRPHSPVWPYKRSLIEEEEEQREEEEEEDR